MSETGTPASTADAEEVVAAAGSDTDSGLTGAQVASRRAAFGPNAIAAERPPSVWAVAASQLRDPMNIMLVAVVVVSLAIGQVSTGVIVGLLIVLNLALGTRQELTARASVDALAKMQTPQARVVRDGALSLVPATEIVPGDVVQVEAGDIVPADGRIVRSATLEAQEAALTGESVPIAKDHSALGSVDVALGDRTNMLFQNTSVTRGTGTIVVTATGERSPSSSSSVSSAGRRPRTCCCWARRWPSPRSPRECRPSSPDSCRWAPSSWLRPRPWSRTSPTSRRSGRRARSTPTRRAR